MRGFAKEGKSILFITHKLNEIMAENEGLFAHKNAVSVRIDELNKTDEELLSFITKTLKEREVYYQQSDFIFNALSVKLEEIIKIIL